MQLRRRNNFSFERALTQVLAVAVDGGVVSYVPVAKSGVEGQSAGIRDSSRLAASKLRAVCRAETAAP
jgi:hypothetical protein